MASRLSPEDYRVSGEKRSLYWGFAVLAAMLIVIGILSAGLLVILVLAITAIVVWVRQGQLLGGCARVSEKQFPEIRSIAQEAVARLGMRQPEIFIQQDPTLNAFAIGFLGRKSVVLNSATVEAMNRAELQQIVGHEFSHIKCGHTNLVVLTNSAEGIDVPVISQILSFVFLFWSRKAEYTCDRGGLLASRDLNAAVAAMCKLAVGPTLFKQMNIDDFLEQHQAIHQDDIARLSENLATHPYLVNRIRAILHFHESDQYRRLIGDDAVSSKTASRRQRKAKA